MRVQAGSKSNESNAFLDDVRLEMTGEIGVQKKDGQDVPSRFGVG